MATSTSPSAADEVLRTKGEKANFQRLARLLMCGGLALLKEVFDAIHPPANLPAVLSNPTIEKQLQNLRRNKVLTCREWDCLYNPRGPGTYGKSADFDISLLSKLLRAICNLKPPATGWDSLPNSTDHSLEVDLVRIRMYRNTIYGHNHIMEITDADFGKLWIEIKEALLRIATGISSAKRDEWKKAIEAFFHEPLTPDAKQYVDDLRSWCLKDMDTKYKLEKVDEKIQQVQINQEQIQRKLEQMEKKQEEGKMEILILLESLKASGQFVRSSPQVESAQLQAEDSPYSSKSSYSTVVAIDFGTSYSELAFSFVNYHGVFRWRGWVNEDGNSTEKTPTCLLLKPDLSFDSFGYEAVEKYEHLQEESSEHAYYFLKHFMMNLHNDQTISTETTIKAANGKSVRALKVFSHSIKFLKDEALKLICAWTGNEDLNVNDIRWVLTVPAIWTPVAKQFMREAAYEAGLGSPTNPEQILIALEPEAAALSCLEKSMSDFRSETGSGSVKGLLTQNTHYMVVSIGASILDVTVHEIQMNGSIKEIHRVTGGPYGGIKVNQQFENLLDELFGAENVRSYRQKFCSDWFSLTNDFEVKKRSDRILQETRMTRIRLPSSFVYQLSRKQTPAMHAYVQKGEVKLKNDECLFLSSEMMKKLFKPTIDRIKDHLKGLLQEPKLFKVKTMLLVGGFADSAFLRQEIKNAFSRRVRVLVPNNASAAVVEGALIFGKQPGKITESVAATTYGADCSRNFIQGVHPEKKKFIADGVEKCK